MSLRKRLVALAAAGGLALTMGGCASNQEEKKYDGVSILQSVSEDVQDHDTEVVRSCYGRFPRTVEVPEEYDYQYVLNINGNKVLAALINEHDFSRKFNLFDGKDDMATGFFYKYDDMITIPDIFCIEDEVAAYHFFRCFVPEVEVNIYKGIDDLYYLERILEYNLNDNNGNSRKLAMYGDGIKLQLLQVLKRKPDNTLVVDTVYYKQTGIGEDCQNVVDANTGSYRQHLLRPGEAVYYSDGEYVPVNYDTKMRPSIKLR